VGHDNRDKVFSLMSLVSSPSVDFITHALRISVKPGSASQYLLHLI